MEKKSILDISKIFAKEIVAGLNKSITPFHAVDYSKGRLIEKGFQEIQEKDPWNLQRGGKYFYTRNSSCLVAFTVGSKFNKESSNSCFKIIGTHTDSPNLRFAPNGHNEVGKYERVKI